MEFSFITWCRECYQKGFTPSNDEYRNSKDFAKAVILILATIKENGLDSFYTYTMDGQYFINLWASHFILEYCNPNEEMKNECLSIIERYSKGRLNKKVADEETLWLKSFKN